MKFSEKLLLRLKHANSLAVLTGAGISAESGVPTFRGKDGLWNKYKVEDLATISAFKKDPELFWKFYNWRRKKLDGVEPNLGHYALVDMEKYFDNFLVITQNVDNLHHQAGSTKLVELHGNIMRIKCSECGEVVDDGKSGYEALPKCSKCSSLMRPDVVLFGENLDQDMLRNAQMASAECEVFLSIGTSSVVEPAASLPYLAKGNGAYLAEINTEPTPLSQHADESIIGSAGKLLPLLLMIIERIK